MTTADTIEMIALNVISGIVIVIPNWYTIIPHVEHGTEFIIKVLVGITVVGLNLYKIVEIREQRAKRKKDEGSVDKES